jgi:rhamnosyltransferase
VQYYLDDGLLSLSYREHYPVRLTASPYLATVDSPEGVADRLLNHRARQVYDLLRDNIRLNVHVQETGFRLHEHNGAGGKQAAARNWTTHYVAPELPRFISMGQAHWLSHEPSGRLVSIILPVKNGAAGLRDLLPRLLRQKTSETIEILAIDSGSTDDTIEVLKSFSATILSIDPQSFNHGLTRNLGVRNARGDIFVFLNQSATPQGDEWLASLIGALDADPAIAGVCSRVLPRPDADVLTYFDGIQDPSGSPERSLRVITDREAYGQLSPHALRLLINFHTVSAAVRPDIVRRIPFREVLIGEDILWAKEVLEAGFKIQHEPSSVVLHSHQYSYLDLFRRNVDDGIANQEIVGRTLSEADIVPTISALARGDWEYLENKCALTTDDLQHWRVNSVLRRTAQIIGQWIGVNRERLPQEMSSCLSLTERIKAGAVPRSKPVENNQYESAAS